MPSNRVADCFGDIVNPIDLILTWIEEAGGIDAAIHHNVLVRNAIERQLLVVSEAAVRLHKLAPDTESTLTPFVR